MLLLLPIITLSIEWMKPFGIVIQGIHTSNDLTDCSICVPMHDCKTRLVDNLTPYERLIKHLLLVNINLSHVVSI